MSYIIYILKILYHAFVTCVIYYTSVYNRKRSISITIGNRCVYAKEPDSTKLLLGSIILFCLLEGLYSFICGPYKTYLVDREVFANRFVGGYFTKSASIGLYYIQVILRKFTTNPDVLFFVVAILFMFISMEAYNTSKIRTTHALLYMCLSQYMLYGCYQLKQSMATAFVGLSLAAFMDKKKMLCVIASVLAVLFHEAAFVLIPLYIVMSGSKVKVVKYSGYLAMIVFVLFFSDFSRIIISMLSRLVPSLSMQLTPYLDETGGLESTGNILTVLKGFPFYYLTWIGMTHRKDVSKKIDKYDNYLILCVFATVANVASAFMAWMWRFSELVYIPLFLFAGALYTELDYSEKTRFNYVFGFSLAFFTFRKLIICYFTYGGLV